MFAIEEAKLPPPTPASAAIASITPNGVPGRCTAHAMADVGRSSRSADTIVQLRPPNRGTANVYGIRSVAPTRLGTAISQNIWSTLKAKPAAGSCGTTMLQTAHTAKPRNSANTEATRLRCAMRRPPSAQNVGSSGSHLSIQRPRAGCVLGGTTGSVIVVGPATVPTGVTVVGVAITASWRVGPGRAVASTLGSGCFASFPRS